MSIFLVNPYLYFTQVWLYGGTTSAYVAGGLTGPTSARTTTIRKFSLASDAADVVMANFFANVAKSQVTGNYSDQHGFISAGITPTVTSTSGRERFPFATHVTASAYGALSQDRFAAAGASSEFNGYVAGGTLAASPLTASVVIDRFPFATNVNATNIGSLVETKRYAGGHTSPTHGYISGGWRNPPAPTYFTTSVRRFSFATNQNASVVLDLATGVSGCVGHSSETDGYTSGGFRISTPPPPVASTTDVQKFPFATNVNATASTIFNPGLYYSAGSSSLTNGYISGGVDTAGANSTSRQKFPFATNTAASTLPNLATSRQQSAGLHV